MTQQAARRYLRTILGALILGHVFAIVLVLVLHRVEVGSMRGTSLPIAVAVETSPTPSNPEEMYLDLLKKTLSRAQIAGRTIRHAPVPRNALEYYLYWMIGRALAPARFELAERVPSDPVSYIETGGKLERRLEDAETMVGTSQLDNVQYCITEVLKNRVPGDVIECGAWRGGLTIFMRGVLRAYGDRERSVWVADSFEGLPARNAGLDGTLLGRGELAASLEEARENFARYGLLDERVHFLKGFFNRTLPRAPIEKLAVLRADGDFYESQMDVLKNLYPKLSVGGYAIIDDYFLLPGCRRAVDEYRKAHNITEKMKRIDMIAVYWQKLR